jgi:putative cardiolipin synthase
MLCLLGLACLLSACATLRTDVARLPSFALPPDPGTPLGQLAGSFMMDGEASTFRLLESGRAALAARLALVEKARHSLDLQYYIFHADASGRLLVDALLDAADRGVRVRLLLDDMYTAEKEAAIIGLDHHPNIEIRLFNPFTVRGNNPLGRLLEWLSGEDRLNRRMHNKLFLADNQFGITGGRNIGDEYFQLEDPRAFLDLDVLTAGRTARDLSTAFDLYWNSEASVPARALPKPQSSRKLLVETRAGLNDYRQSEKAAYSDYLSLDVLGREPGPGFGPWSPGRAEVLLDSPEKPVKTGRKADLPAVQLLTLGIHAKRELLISSPYLVPGRLGLDLLQYLRGRDVKVSVLTNSLAANDVALVHAAYAGYRAPMVISGVRLHELKPLKQAAAVRMNLGGSSSRASLHTKAMVFDRVAVYIGSMNLDPRSVLLNTEAGLIIHSESLADQVAVYIERAMAPDRSYRVRLNQESDQAVNPLQWHETVAGEEVIHRYEPGAGLRMRFLIDLMKGLEIESQL